MEVAPVNTVLLRFPLTATRDASLPEPAPVEVEPRVPPETTIEAVVATVVYRTRVPVDRTVAV